jgi:uncharacterized protein (TIGR03067 family)
LLFGILALQMDFISRDALIQAMNSWVLEKTKPLSQILLDHGALGKEPRMLLESLVAEHLKQHGDNPCWILWRLSRSSGSRVLRELWSGLVVLVPSVLLCAFTLATLLPLVKMVEGMMPMWTKRDQAVRQERTLLEGTWKLVGGQLSGQPLGEKELEGVTLSFGGEGFAWTRRDGLVRGHYFPDLTRRPKVVELYYWDRGHQEMIHQAGIYEFDGSRLRICLAPPRGLGNDLPIDFSTKGNKSTVYTFQRVGDIVAK